MPTHDEDILPLQTRNLLEGLLQPLRNFSLVAVTKGVRYKNHSTFGVARLLHFREILIIFNQCLLHSLRWWGTHEMFVARLESLKDSDGNLSR